MGVRIDFFQSAPRFGCRCELGIKPNISVRLSCQRILRHDNLAAFVAHSSSARRVANQLQDCFGEHLRVAEAGNTQMLAEAILELVRDPARTRRMRHECREIIVSKYSLAAQADRYVRLYSELAATPESRRTLKKVNPNAHTTDSEIVDYLFRQALEREESAQREKGVRRINRQKIVAKIARRWKRYAPDAKTCAEEIERLAQKNSATPLG